MIWVTRSDEILSEFDRAMRRDRIPTYRLVSYLPSIGEKHFQHVVLQ